MARNKLRKEKELNQIKKSTNVFFNIIFIVKNFDYPEKPLKYKHIRRISD